MNVIELVSRPDSQQPGGVGGIRQPPVMIKQRPFKPTQFKVPKPPVASVNPNRVKPPVFATGIPLPQLLIPEGDFNQVSPKPQVTSPVKIKTETLKKPTSNVVDTEKKVEGPLKISVPKLQNAFVIPSNKNGKRPLTASGSNNMDFNFPGKGVSLDELLNNLSQEDDEDIELEPSKVPSVTVAILPTTTRVILPILQASTTTTQPTTTNRPLDTLTAPKKKVSFPTNQSPVPQRPFGPQPRPPPKRGPPPPPPRQPAPKGPTPNFPPRPQKVHEATNATF